MTAALQRLGTVTARIASVIIVLVLFVTAVEAYSVSLNLRYLDIMYVARMMNTQLMRKRSIAPPKNLKLSFARP